MVDAGTVILAHLGEHTSHEQRMGSPRKAQAHCSSSHCALLGNSAWGQGSAPALHAPGAGDTATKAQLKNQISLPQWCSVQKAEMERRKAVFHLPPITNSEVVYCDSFHRDHSNFSAHTARSFHAGSHYTQPHMKGQSLPTFHLGLNKAFHLVPCEILADFSIH